jgi:hypothetical protein
MDKRRCLRVRFKLRQIIGNAAPRYLGLRPDVHFRLRYAPFVDRP